MPACPLCSRVITDYLVRHTVSLCAELPVLILHQILHQVAQNCTNARVKLPQRPLYTKRCCIRMRIIATVRREFVDEARL